ncbi:oligopeptide/dipeptide ABC transporter ATP-binding protein [Jiella sp. M17.18]|uniref:oligopeptide/dipeptide ABC transporter ATP-binding protein n=1 Tax=Jiella sp. M17.18 TaxID=3234247 RepID=UPI0034DE328A
MADHIGVMYLGQLVEVGEADALFAAPRHPYTALLLKAAPDLDVADRSLHAIPGELPSAASPPAGCRFHPRWPRAQALCAEQEPALAGAPDGDAVRCNFPLDARQVRRPER